MVVMVAILEMQMHSWHPEMVSLTKLARFIGNNLFVTCIHEFMGDVMFGFSDRLSFKMGFQQCT